MPPAQALLRKENRPTTVLGVAVPIRVGRLVVAHPFQ
jgi:hypothetical protein